jgi:hypothetical protein
MEIESGSEELQPLREYRATLVPPEVRVFVATGLERGGSELQATKRNLLGSRLRNLAARLYNLAVSAEAVALAGITNKLSFSALQQFPQSALRSKTSLVVPTAPASLDRQHAEYYARRAHHNAVANQ